MIVDALGLCYTKPHVDTFVIISATLVFPLWSVNYEKNNKAVISVGVKNSTSVLFWHGIGVRENDNLTKAITCMINIPC